MSSNGNLAARVGRWSAEHSKTAILGWFAFVVVALVIGGSAGTKTLDYAESGVGESGHADRTVYHSFPQKSDEGVLIQSNGADATDPRFRAVVGDAMRTLRDTAGVEELTSPYAHGGANLSPDGGSALITYSVSGDQAEAKEKVEAPVAAIEDVARRSSGFRVEAFGDATSESGLKDVIDGDLHRAEFISLPVTLAILMIAFGGLVVAGVPVLLALSAVLATLGLVGPISQISPVADSIGSVVLLIGLAVGVDYALFYTRRVREERAAGREHRAAIEAAAATSGRAVLISGVTVVTAMAGMYLAGAADFASFATGTIVVVLLAMAGSVTVLPALLSKMTKRIDGRRGRIRRWVGARMERLDFWGRISAAVMRRPAVAATAALVVLLALALPAIGMKTADGGVEGLPQNVDVVQTFNRVQDAFPGESTAATVVIEADDVTSGALRRDIGGLVKGIEDRDDVFPGRPEVEINPDGTVAQVSVRSIGDGTDEESQRALDVLREKIVPATVGRSTGVETSVTGPAAQNRDFNESMVAHLPLVFGFVLCAAFMLLMVTFRSIVIPIKAIVLNLLSVGAAYGILVTVFQGEWAEKLLGFNSTGAIVPWLPLFLFVVLFGLSMDYHVFILTRIKEAHDGGMTTRDAVEHGIRSTAGVVTSAALVMVAVFSIFAALSLLDFKQMGVGLAAAVLIDATLIRGVLLPATMTLLGERNWWLPRTLGWLPRIEPEEEPATT
ncbi:MAG: MMPL family transporter [Thermoleophilales bacterium]|nr:MMPL family transporter [Thermoleophilales bacterium]